MYLNDRKEGPELLHYRALGKRANLSFDDKRNLKVYEDGFSGECLYDKLFDEIGHDNLYIFRDVYLTAGKSGAQYDSIIISGDEITINEIKNYTGEYYYKEGRFIKNGEIVPDNPFTQVERAAGKLYRICRNSRINADVITKVIFPNDDFKLYSEDNSIWKNIVIRMDMKKYFRSFKVQHNTEKSGRLVSMIRGHISENPYFNGSRNTGDIRRGLYCGNCGNFNLIKTRYHRECSRCKTKESNETHMLRAMSDYKYLYYGGEMTRRKLMELIGDDFHPEVFRRALNKYCVKNRKGKNTEYVFKYYDFEEAMQHLDQTSKYKNYHAEF